MERHIRSIAAAAARAVRPSLSGASVLCYHSIGDNAARSTIPPSLFDQQIAYIASRRVIVAPSELVRRYAAGEDLSDLVSITFDDGYEDNLTRALPVLEKHRVQAGAFVITSLIGASYTYSGGVTIPLMNAAQLKEARERGLEIMTHTRMHRDARDVPDAELESEFEGSRRELEEIVGRPVPKIVAYPKGRSDERVRAWLRGRGWHAFGTRGGIVKPGSQSCDLERNGVIKGMSGAGFKLLLSDGVSLYERLRALR